MEKESRRWCPVWSQKFPSFSHDPTKNFTFCRLCRNSKVPTSQCCRWAEGHGPPSSGWRVRRLVRHLGSQEHLSARRAALDLCRKATEYEKQNGNDKDSPPASEVFGDPSTILGTGDDGLEHPGLLDFKEVTTLLNMEVVMMKAYSSSYVRPRAQKRPRMDMQPYPDLPTMVSLPGRGSPNVPCLEILYDDVGNDFADENANECISDDACDPPEQAIPAFATLRQKTARLYPRTLNGDSNSHRDPDDGALEVPIDSLLCLPESLKLLAESQTRIANAIESMVGLQREVLRTMRDVSETLKKNNGS